MPHPKGGYKTKDGKRVPGVTTIIGRFKDSGALLWWAFAQGKSAERGEISSLYDKRDEAADNGTLAHELVEKLEGPFDFVFSDADKDWYKNYFISLAPKLEVGGCFTAHNASNTGMEGVREFLDYVKGLPNFKTHLDTTSRAGISISYKIAKD